MNKGLRVGVQIDNGRIVRVEEYRGPGDIEIPVLPRFVLISAYDEDGRLEQVDMAYRDVADGPYRFVGFDGFGLCSMMPGDSRRVQQEKMGLVGP